MNWILNTNIGFIIGERDRDIGIPCLDKVSSFDGNISVEQDIFFWKNL